MSTITSSPPRTARPAVSNALRLDAAASGALGVALAVATPVVEDWLGLPVPLSLGVAGFLLAWAALCAWVARDPRPGRVREISVLNLGWVGASVAFLLLDPVGLTTLGAVLVVVQALAVVGLVALTTVATRAATSVGASSIGA